MEKSILILKASCIIQFANAILNYLAFALLNYHVPSWTLSVIMALNAIIIWCLLHDKKNTT